MHELTKMIQNGRNSLMTKTHGTLSFNTQIAGEYRINCISLLILSIFHNLLSLGGTWGLLAEQQDV